MLSKLENEMTLAELYLEAARVVKMIEGTNLRVGDCFKLNGIPFNSHHINFDSSPDRYEACLTIVEGKPVFKGDYMYHPAYESAQRIDELSIPSEWSWNPPKPKTVMVEMLFEDAQYVISSKGFNREHVRRIEEACLKALEESK
jgi:hypothetical protein